MMRLNPLEFVKHYFEINACKLNERSLYWMMLSKLQLFDEILNTNLRFSYADLDNPLSCLHITREYAVRKNVIIALKSVRNFALLVVSLNSQWKLQFLLFSLKKRAGFKDFIRYLLVLRLLEKYKVAKNVPCKRIDDLNMPLAQRLSLAISGKFEGLLPSVHGGGIYVYKGFPFDKFKWQAQQIELRSHFFRGLPEFDNKLLFNDNPLSVSLATYWFHRHGGTFQSQVFLSVSDHISLLKQLQKNYGESNVLLRDPSKLSGFFKSSVTGMTKIDGGNKDQRKYNVGALWSDAFLNSDLKIVTAFFSLGLQLLFSEHPTIIVVTRESFYDEYIAVVDDLITIGVFVTEVSSIKTFIDKNDLRLWWEASKKSRMRFLELYFEVVSQKSGCELVVK